MSKPSEDLATYSAVGMAFSESARTSHKHTASDITGVIPPEKGGTGVSSIEELADLLSGSLDSGPGEFICDYTIDNEITCSTSDQQTTIVPAHTVDNLKKGLYLFLIEIKTNNQNGIYPSASTYLNIIQYYQNGNLISNENDSSKINNGVTSDPPVSRGDGYYWAPDSTSGSNGGNTYPKDGIWRGATIVRFRSYYGYPGTIVCTYYNRYTTGTIYHFNVKVYKIA